MVGCDRFILERHSVNFNCFDECNWELDKPCSSSTIISYSSTRRRDPYYSNLSNNQQTKATLLSEIKKNYRWWLVSRALSAALGLHFNFRQNNSQNQSQIPLCPSFWEFKPRVKPMMKIHQTFGSSVLSLHDIWTEMAAVGYNGRFVAMHKQELTQSWLFCSSPSNLEVVKYKRPFLKKHVITSIWLHASGQGILLGFFGGMIQVVEEGHWLRCREKIWRCPCTEASDGDACSISCLDCHSTRSIIYWGCEHGVFGKCSYGPVPLLVQRLKNKPVCMKLSPSGAYLATSAVSAGIFIWDAYRLKLVHHLRPSASFAKAMDWHPWVPNLLATADWSDSGVIQIWRCNQDQPHVADIAHNQLRIFTMRFHPFTGELVYSSFQFDEDELVLDKGESVVVVMDGTGRIVDCSQPHQGLISHIFWGPQATELLIGGAVDKLVRYKFVEKKPTDSSLFLGPSSAGKMALWMPENLNLPLMNVRDIPDDILIVPNAEKRVFASAPRGIFDVTNLYIR